MRSDPFETSSAAAIRTTPKRTPVKPAHREANQPSVLGRPSSALARIAAAPADPAVDQAVIAAVSAALGVPATEVRPRDNVLTFRAWLAKGRCVAKGQKAVKVGRYILFHESQTTELRSANGEMRVSNEAARGDARPTGNPQSLPAPQEWSARQAGAIRNPQLAVPAWKLHVLAALQAAA